MHSYRGEQGCEYAFINQKHRFPPYLNLVNQNENPKDVAAYNFTHRNMHTHTLTSKYTQTNCR